MRWLLLAAGCSALCACSLDTPTAIVFIKAETSLPDALQKNLGVKTATSTGTGFAVNGRIYTCKHVVENAEPDSIIVMLSNGTTQKATLIRSDYDTDLAELQIPNPPQSLQLRDFPPIVNENVSQIGNPNNLLFVTSVGTFAGTNGHENIFLLDTYSGSSGSPIMDKHLRVIGMTHGMVVGTRFTTGGQLNQLRHFIYPNRPN